MKEEQELVEAYRRLNGSFQKKCVFHVGASAGFFSEYNMMLLAMLYCLTHHIRFVLFSADANFAYDKGWTDYFESFCDEVRSSQHCKLNQRPVGGWKTMWRMAREKRSVGILCWKLKSQLFSLMAFFHKRCTGVTYYTQDIWHELLSLRTDGRYRIPELGIDGDLSTALRTLARITWRFNPEAMNEIRKIRSAITLPEKYMGCQMRGGDKFIEFALVPVEDYISVFKSCPDIKDVFVLTDDYRIMEELQNHYKDYCWHSLCQPSEQGYFHGDFVKNGKDYLRRRMLRFFASIDILTGASFYVGTRTSNPSVFLYIFMPEACADTDGDRNLLSDSTLGIK